MSKIKKTVGTGSFFVLESSKGRHMLPGFGVLDRFWMILPRLWKINKNGSKYQDTILQYKTFIALD